jgi:endonuclease/exonuclease/phosphatase family metal-dependent hydrolase
MRRRRLLDLYPLEIGKPERDIVAVLSEVPLAARQLMRAGPFDAQTHHRHVSALRCLHEIELGGAPGVQTDAGKVRVAVWNVERLRSPAAVSALLKPHRPNVTLLTEVDKGMVRSGNRDGLADLTSRLGHQYAYAVEFVELGLGDEGEVPADNKDDNALGFHGNAVTSAFSLQRPFLVRLDADGGWFGPERGQQRVGGRMAAGAQIVLAERPVTIVSVHLESNSDPAERAAQVARLISGIEEYDAAAPILIGGDFNTSTIDRRRGRDDDFRRAEFAADPRRLIEVEAHEPLFQVMARHDFEWRASNLPEPTERTQPGRPQRERGKIDWIFSRGLASSEPLIIAALDENDAQISDHDCLLVTIAP